MLFTYNLLTGTNLRFGWLKKIMKKSSKRRKINFGQMHKQRYRVCNR